MVCVKEAYIINCVNISTLFNQQSGHMNRAIMCSAMQCGAATLISNQNIIKSAFLKFSYTVSTVYWMRGAEYS